MKLTFNGDTYYKMATIFGPYKNCSAIKAFTPLEI